MQGSPGVWVLPTGVAGCGFFLAPPYEGVGRQSRGRTRRWNGEKKTPAGSARRVDSIARIVGIAEGTLRVYRSLRTGSIPRLNVALLRRGCYEQEFGTGWARPPFRPCRTASRSGERTRSPPRSRGRG